MIEGFLKKRIQSYCRMVILESLLKLGHFLECESATIINLIIVRSQVNRHGKVSERRIILV